MGTESIAEVPRPQQAAKLTTGRLHSVAWDPDGEMDFQTWLAAGRRLGRVGRGCQWWLGDWIRYGQHRFGERYSHASRATGYDTQTLMNMVYVASRFEISRRREDLSWSHHESVASLESEDQDRWLSTAASEKMSVSDLRIEMRSALRHETADIDKAEFGDPEDAAMVCPNCGHVLS